MAWRRWSDEDKARAARRRDAVIWLHDVALVSFRDMQHAMPGTNAHDDYVDGGGRGRSWLTRSDRQREANHLHPPKRPPLPQMDDVRPVEPPAYSIETTVAWWARESTESSKALQEALGRRVSQRKVRTYPARRRGTNGWSATDLDRLFPDLTPV